MRADLAEDVYMRLPEGCSSLSGKVVKLGKSLHGLRQASRQWYALLKKCFFGFGVRAVLGRFVCFSFG